MSRGVEDGIYVGLINNALVDLTNRVKEARAAGLTVNLYETGAHSYPTHVNEESLVVAISRSYQEGRKPRE